jgi:DNA-directed RNA polymerase subunit RPC12/RpoP
MPNVYKEKECPTCSKKHRKKGEYCCQSCSSRTLVMPQSAKDSISSSMREQHLQPDRIAHTRLLQQGIAVKSEDFAINIPDIPDLDDYEGYLKGEDW